MVYLLRYNVYIIVCNQKYTVLVKNLRTTTRITYKIHKKKQQITAVSVIFVHSVYCFQLNVYKTAAKLTINNQPPLTVNFTKLLVLVVINF